MTSQRLVEDFARWLWARDRHSDHGRDLPRDDERTPDNYVIEAAVFLAGELGQRLQHGQRGMLQALATHWVEGTEEGQGVKREHWRGRDFIEGYDFAREDCATELRTALDGAS